VLTLESSEEAKGERLLARQLAYRRENVMGGGYDKERTDALLKEAQEITAHLRIETKVLERQMAKVLDGQEDEAVDNATVVAKAAVGATWNWRFWR
jgi:hypothetical protein